jgi:hypothetical protein
LLSSAYQDSDHHYIEPFAGSAALFFCLKPSQGTLADLNGHLVNAMRHVRDQPRVLHRRLGLMPRTSQAYYQARVKFNEMKPYGIRAAVLFIYLNRNCFNGLWRTNSTGEFNVPYGGTEMGSNPPLGAIFGLGCEPDLALGALQLLEPNKAWIFKPKGIDPKFDAAMKAANLHIEDIFDVSNFSYEILKPASARGRLEALLNAIEKSFRLIVVPFGPKIFAWLAISTVVFSGRSNVGVWAFSSKEHASVVDRDAEGQVIWHTLNLEQAREQKAANY